MGIPNFKVDHLSDRDLLFLILSAIVKLDENIADEGETPRNHRPDTEAMLNSSQYRQWLEGFIETHIEDSKNNAELLIFIRKMMAIAGTRKVFTNTPEENLQTN